MHRTALLLAALSSVPAVLQAQRCIGQAPWSSGKLKVGGELHFNGGTAILGTLGFGKDRGMFAGIGGGIVTNGGTAGVVQGGIGWELKEPVAGKLELCPIGGLTVEFGEGATFVTGTGGVSLGYPVAMTAANVGLTIIGAGQIGVTRGSFSDCSICDNFTDGFGLLDGGVGFVFNNRISLSGLLRIPVASPGSDVGFIIRANVAVGKQGG
jgi:hypothetical protein